MNVDEGGKTADERGFTRIKKKERDKRTREKNAINKNIPFG
jgi:hypothetical protein